MFIAALFKTAKVEILQVSMTGDWLHKIRSIHTTQKCAALKKNAILIRATVRVNPENSMLSEISQTLRTNAIRMPLHEAGKISTFTKTDHMTGVTGS